MSKLKIQVKRGSENVLVGFPMRDGQHFDARDTEIGYNYEYRFVDLGDYEDTTAAQEQHLDTNPDVINYMIVN
jgi:hypothetical protein